MHGFSGVVQIAAGTYHSVALKSNHTVWAWGENYYGQLGNGLMSQCPTGIPADGWCLLPAEVPGLSQVAQVAAGYAHNLTLVVDHHLALVGMPANISSAPPARQGQ